ncbi:MAG: 30S ribosomal protein S3ae [Candidatus Thermoplasmatota archaeon]|nr:30S ribosomal protein S3ae [Candidatus Thermoplasmatota archaeon]
MAGERSNKRTKDKWKEKKWFRIMAPSQLGGKEIAMTVGTAPESIKGRIVEIPISDFSGNFKKSNAKLEFKVLDCVGTKCSTIFVGHSVNDDYVRRMVRRRKERIDIVKTVKTTDGYEFVLKVVAVTENKLTSAKSVELRNAITNMVEEKVKNMDYFEFVRFVIEDESVSEILTGIKDIYPLKKLEFRKSELTGTGEKYNFSVPEEPAAEEVPAQ